MTYEKAINRNVIVIGDFNAECNDKNQHCSIFTSFLNDNELLTIEKKFTQEVNYTFRSHNSLSSIDHMLCSR